MILYYLIKENSKKHTIYETSKKRQKLSIVNFFNQSMIKNILVMFWKKRQGLMCLGNLDGLNLEMQAN